MTTETFDRLKGGIWNMERDRNKRKVRKGLIALLKAHDLDFLMVQEAHDYQKLLTRIPGYDLVGTEGHTAKTQCPILVRKTVPHGKGWVKSMGGDGWVTVTHKNHAPSYSGTVLIGHWLRLVNVHAPVTVSWPHGRIAGPVERVDDYADHSREIVQMNRWREKHKPHHGLIVGGDWNARTFEHGTFTPHWIAQHTSLKITEPKHRKGPGHDGIDYLLSRGVTIKHMVKHGTSGSDHPLVTFVAKRP